MTKFLKIFFASIFILSVIGNLIWLNLQLINNTSQGIRQPIDLWTARINELEDRIVKLEDQPIATSSAPVINQITQQIIQPTKVVVPTAVPSKSTPREYIIPLGSGGITENDKWIDIYSAQAQIDTANYTNIDKAYFEVVMHVVNGQGTVKAKLLETTIPFYYGEILQSQSGTGELVSTSFNLQPGKRTYRVQLNNQIGSAVLDSARIKIITK